MSRGASDERVEALVRLLGLERPERPRLLSELVANREVHVLLPDGEVPAGGYPTAVLVHGHSPLGYDYFRSANEVYVKGAPVAELLREAGFAVVLPAMRGFGATMDPADRALGLEHSCERLARQRLLAGGTLLGDRVRDLMELLDALERDGRFDLERVVVAGYSGGGTAALFHAACDARVHHVILLSALCTARHSLLATRHCLCNYVPGLLTFGDWGDVAALVAPRRLTIVHGERDGVFPFAGARAAFAAVQAAYEALGCEENAQFLEQPGGHEPYPEVLWQCAGVGGKRANVRCEEELA
ncbi:alpha/beta hydrolase family protein [Alicyclobacillus sendaiensis]|uniref:Alpha/beta fold hydrolase n=1 Tax=Alicyclobacillus sendaiensis PA2 TaxID=3029425 RepID=A0ABT6XWN8_ALISE|nr:alpha/beta fold hydrolase [Alicyclobacillus sendaiensis]MDI9259486.1 alpha/beta fold hydrolase [Alicyclobacillus sendaiensis PA2]